MNLEVDIIFIICYSVACILLYKYYLFNKKKKDKKIIKGTCTNTVYKTGYSKNTYTYFYSYILDNEEYSLSDIVRFKIPFFNPKINDEVNILVDIKNPNDYITPFAIFFAKIYLYGSIFLLLFPFLFLI